MAWNQRSNQIREMKDLASFKRRALLVTWLVSYYYIVNSDRY